MREKERWLERELNPRHEDFQSSALPTELSSRMAENPKSDCRTSNQSFPGCHYGGFFQTGKRGLLMPRHLWGETLSSRTGDGAFPRLDGVSPHQITLPD